MDKPCFRLTSDTIKHDKDFHHLLGFILVYCYYIQNHQENHSNSIKILSFPLKVDYGEAES